MPRSSGGGEEANTLVGAIQPKVAAEQGFSTSWRKTSRLTGSTGLASNGLEKRATVPPILLVRRVEAVGDSK